MKIAVAGTGYVGLSIALLLSQHNEVHALDIVPKKVELLNNGKSPIVDPAITDFLKKNASGERPLNFHATVNAQEASVHLTSTLRLTHKRHTQTSISQ